jgi:hypothetical protein
VKLGAYVKSGSFSDVYRKADQPRKVIKIGRDPTESPASFTRQINDAKRLTQAGVETPRIDKNWDPGTPTSPGSLTTDYVKYDEFDPAKPAPKGTAVMFKSEGDLVGVPAAERAMRGLYDKTAQAGYVLVDGAPRNVVFKPNGSGGFTPIVIDPDMVMTPEEIAQSLKDGTLPGEVIGGVLSGGGVMRNAINLFQGKPISAATLSNDLFVARFLSSRFNGANPTIPK